MRRGSDSLRCFTKKACTVTPREATHFPQAIALASSWDPDLLTRVFTVAGREIPSARRAARARSVVDVARDARWGRIEETYGEDPYLVGELGVAAVRGFQGDTLPLGRAASWPP